jgi:hypothetical protein
MRSSFLIASLAIAAAVILGLTLYLRQSAEEPAFREPLPPVGQLTDEPATSPVPDAVQSAAEEVMTQTPPSPAINEQVLPLLNQSDDFVRERIPEAVPAPWREREDLLRRAAVVLENATRGEIPKRQLSFLAPDGSYPVRKVEVPGADRPRFFVDPAGFARYDRYLDMLEALPPEDMALLLKDTAPLLAEAMAELGTQVTVNEAILEAVDQMLAVPVLRGEVELVQPKVLFEYADPALEGLTDVQKQVLRMGPDNVERLQAYLRAMRAGLRNGR